MHDTLYSWSEIPDDPPYFTMKQDSFYRDIYYNSDDNKYQLGTNFEKRLSNNIMMRIAGKISWSNSDLKGESTTSDTLVHRRTYDEPDEEKEDTYHFSQEIFNSYKMLDFNGTGDSKRKHFKSFMSLIYELNKDWSLFSGIYFSYKSNEKDTKEHYSLDNNSYTEYRRYSQKVKRSDLDDHLQFDSTRTKTITTDITYKYNSDIKNWNFILPIGFNIEVINNFKLLAGYDLRFKINKKEYSGKKVTNKETKKWVNESLTLDDNLNDHDKLYHSKSPLTFDKNTNVNFGISYHHPSDLNIYIRTAGDILQTSHWSVGIEKKF